METIVFVLMILVCFNFLLKQTFRKWSATIGWTLACSLFIGWAWRYAIEQSKTQIADWLGNPALMLDTSVILTMEISIQMAYALLAVHIKHNYPVRPRTLMAYRFLRWFPGLLIFPVLFSGLVALIFSFPGYSFSAIAWCFAAFIALLIPIGKKLIIRLLPEKELRLELFFLTNALTAILGVIATVNGRTATSGTGEIDWKAFAGVLLIGVTGFFLGVIRYKYKRIPPLLSRSSGKDIRKDADS